LFQASPRFAVKNRESCGLPTAAKKARTNRAGSRSRLAPLPIAPAASTLSAAASAAIATPAVPAAPSATASSVAATCSAPSATFLLRPSFIHHQRAAQKIFSVQGFDRFNGVGIIRNFRKTESARLISETVPQQRECIGLNSNFRKHRGDLFFRGFERQITEIQFLHDRSP
jgi:hypothetical protein